MIKRQKWINRKTGQIREAALTLSQANGHGYDPYEEPKVEKVVKAETKPDKEPDPQAEEPENAALAPKPEPKPAAKKTARKAKTPKPE